VYLAGVNKFLVSVVNKHMDRYWSIYCFKFCEYSSDFWLWVWCL